MGASSALAGRLNRSCVLYKSCAISEMVGRVWSSNVGSSRVTSGQVGISRVKAGDIFFLAIGVVKLLHRFFRCRRRFLVLAASPRHSSTTFTDAGLKSVRWGAGCRVRTLQVGLSRAEAGSFPLYGLLRLASRTFPRCLCWAMGRQIVRSLQSCKSPPSPSDSQPVGVMRS